jgi:maltose O-acetyltransferase
MDKPPSRKEQYFPMSPDAPIRSEREKMIAGELYFAEDPALIAARAHTHALLDAYNATRDTAILPQLLGEIGPGCVLRAPFFCDYGFNIHLGTGVFFNFNCVLLDVAPIHIGDRTQIGPAVQIYAADHPRDPEIRRSGLELGRPIRIGADVWIGGGAILLPGITVGDNAIIGAGSIVTKDVPANTTVLGNPARPRA